MRITVARLAIGAVVVALAAGTAGGFLGALLSSGSAQPVRSGTKHAACDVTAVAAKVFPSLVTVYVQASSGSGNGAGSVLDKQGYILTNDHVIKPAVSGGRITVDFARGQRRIRAVIVGRDPATDLAVIRVPSNTGSLAPITIGDSAELNVGQPVVAAGSPLGLNTTITSGIVSALSRYIDVGQGDRLATLVNGVQTDAAINPGNSGGPLTDCSGRQVGVNTAGAQLPDSYGGSIGLNFAIPISFAHSIAEQLIKSGRATHPNIGVLCSTVTAEISSATGLPKGALVEQVLPGLGADRARIRPGDVITRVGDDTVNGVDQFLLALSTHQAGDSIHTAYVRDGSSYTANVTVAEVGR